MLKKGFCRRIIVLAVLFISRIAFAEWPTVPPMDWTHVRPGDFADNELEIPYMLEHFHTVANAVVEQGPTRGFLNIKVAREPKDNEPYNARIQENNLCLAYFYCTKRTWNPYYGSDAVKIRLEAMLEFWCSIQSPEGMFSEYKPQGWGIAPTGFGTLAMGQTLLLLNAGGPTIDHAVLERTMASQRKAIMCILTNDQMYRWASDYSNQFSGVYFAALSYLRLKDDAEMRSALDAGVKHVISVTQGPTGLLYEAGGLDFGYSHVHENNIRIAAPLLGDDPIVRDAIVEETQRYNKWRGYNLVLQPDHSGYFVNAGVECRTNFAFEGFASKPMSQVVESERCFAMTDSERQLDLKRRRDELAANWPHFRPLVVPGSKSFHPGEIYGAVLNRDTFFPTAEQRDTAIEKLPYLADNNWTLQGYDPRNYVYSYVRRPTYYAIFNSGHVRIPGHQNLGMGLLWNDKLGCVMQSVGGTDIAWGTRIGSDAKVVETHDIAATITAGGKSVTVNPGYQSLPPTDIEIDYDMPGGGKKHLTLSRDAISVSIEHSGPFVEQLPLVISADVTISHQRGMIDLTSGGNKMHIRFDPGIESQIDKISEPDKGHAFSRGKVDLHGDGKLEYQISFN